MGKRKYNTEEERKAAIRESNRKSARKRREANPDKVKEYGKKWRENNPEKVKEIKRKFKEKNPDYFKERMKEWVKDNPDLNRKHHKNYYDRNRDEVLLREKKYRSTKNGKAKNLVGSYRRSDKLANRGECTITKEWMVDNAFSGQICFYCKESDWTKLGCDRINNDLPHTPENVVVCCEECNKKRGRKTFEEFCKEIGNTDKLKELEKNEALDN